LRDYEVVFIIDDRQLDVNLEKFSEQVVSRVEELGGKVYARESLGRKQFVYPIKKQQAGTYLDFVIALDPQRVEEFTESYRLSDEVLRVKVFVYEAKQRSQAPSAEAADVPEDAQQETV